MPTIADEPTQRTEPRDRRHLEKPNRRDHRARVRRATPLALLGAVGLSILAASPVAAQEAGLRPPRILPPARSLAGTDDSDALGLNPAQIAFAPSWELRYTHVEVPTSAQALSPGRGDAVGFALPLFFGFATGLRFESIRPPDRVPVTNLQTWAWSFAYKASDALALSLDFRHFRPLVDGLENATTLGLSTALRPSPYYGIAIAARDLSGARGQVVAPGIGIDRSFDFGLALRPLGTRALEVGLETSVFPSAPKGDVWAPRATLGVDVPAIGRAMAAFQVVDPIPTRGISDTWTVTAGLEVGIGNARLGGGVVAGRGLASEGPGWYASAAIAGFKQPGIPEGGRAVRIRIEDTPGARAHVRLLRKLARLGRDPTVRAVALVLKTDPASSTAHAEELADALGALRARGIKVLCHWEDAGGKALVACSPADKILVHPAGGLRFAGLRSQTMYYGEALQKLGIEPQFLRIREHKSAPEAFVRSGPTPASAEHQKAFLAKVNEIYVGRIAAGRRLPRETVIANIAKGPFVADEALAAGFVDAKAFDDELGRHVNQVVGRPIHLEDDEAPTNAPQAFGRTPRIAVIYLDGDIVDGRSQKIPLLGTRLAGSYTIAEALEQARKDPSIRGVVLRIESPGGSSLASDVMWREAELLSKVKPVVVSMGSVAASGGYYAAAFGAPIFANASTITGSIGIFYGKADVSPLLSKLGVHVTTQKTAPKADAESLYRAFTPEELIELARKVEQFYSVFLDRVARGRKMTIDQVDAVGRGRVWLGIEAKERALVDVVGGFDAALAKIRAEAELPDDAPVVELPSDKGGLLDLVLDAFGVDAGPPPVAALPKALAPFANALAPFVVYEPDVPLALWEGLDPP